MTKVGELSNVEVPQSHQLPAVDTVGLIFRPCPSITEERSEVNNDMNTLNSKGILTYVSSTEVFMTEIKICDQHKLC